MNRFHWSVLVASFTVWSSTSATAFDNIEADYLYGSTIKDQIRKEFLLGLKMLKEQADGLGMQVRDKDVIDLQHYMYEKAYMMGRCVDQAVTLKKMTSDKILLDKSVKGCIDIHIKFMAWLQSPKTKQSVDLPDPKDYLQDDRTIDPINRVDFLSRTQYISMQNGPSFDFFDRSHMSALPTDYVATRECYRNSWTKLYRQKHSVVPPDYLFDKLTGNSMAQSLTSNKPTINNKPTKNAAASVPTDIRYRADLDLADSTMVYQTLKTGTEEAKKPLIAYLLGLSEGINMANVYLYKSHRDLIYCLPDNLHVDDTTLIVTVYQSFYEDTRNRKTEALMNTFTPDVLLAEGFRWRYPCKPRRC